jgi:hypothetical protein
VERPSEGKYTTDNIEAVDTDTTGLLIGGQRRVEQAMS